MIKYHAIHKALTRLVELKEGKAVKGKDNTYVIERAIAWDAAKEALMMPDDKPSWHCHPDVAAHDEVMRLERKVQELTVKNQNLTLNI
jgi:hypothetical protein